MRNSNKSDTKLRKSSDGRLRKSSESTVL
jgi:hypothetical protein